MKIVVLGLRGFPKIQGGVETHCEHLFTRIAKRGHEVIVLGRKPYTGPLARDYEGVRIVPLPCPRHKSLEAFLHTLLGVLRARSLRPDILHIHAIGPSLFVPMARMLGMRTVTTNHGPDYARAKWGFFAKATLRVGEFLGCRYANAVVAISEPIAQHLREAFGCQPVVIPNGVIPRPPSPGVTTLQKFGLESGRYLIAVSRLVPEKGLHDLIDAFHTAQLPGWKLAIVGGADHEDAYSRSLKKKAAATAGTVMTGFQSGEALAQLYTHAGLFVLPSYHEGLPIALLEAMSYGLRVLASDIPANRQAGLPADQFFPPGDIAAATEKIRQLSAEPFAEEQRRRQIDDIARQFDWSLVTDRTVAVYDAVAHDKPAVA